MEPEEKRLKIDKDSIENGILNKKISASNESSFDGRNSKENHGSQAAEIERAEIDAGNGQLPVCDHGVECSETDLIHFAEFWHPTKTEEREIENEHNEGECYEKDECEFVELPFHEVEATQQVCEDYSDSESDDVDGADENSNTLKKSKDEQPSADSLKSQ